MTRASNGSVSVVAFRLVILLAGAIVGSLLLLTGCKPPPEEGVLALVNGRQITQTEFETRWGELADATRARYEKFPGMAARNRLAPAVGESGQGSPSTVLACRRVSGIDVP